LAKPVSSLCWHNICNDITLSVCEHIFADIISDCPPLIFINPHKQRILGI